MPIKIPKPLKISLILFSLLLVSLALTNIDKQTTTDQYFFGAKNLHWPILHKEPEIEKLIQDFLKNRDGRYGIYVKDLTPQKSYQYNSGEKFDSASLYKLAVLWAVENAIENGNLNRDEILSSDQFSLDQALNGQDQSQIGSNGDNLPQGIVSYSVDEALKLMITISDNYSAILLAQRLGWQNIDSLMKNEGFSQIDLVSQDYPQVTAQAIGDLLERIYAGKAVSPQASQEMKSLLFAQQINGLIPKYLPADIKVGHKTGELDLLRHDAGIVLGKNSHYIFVFLSETPVPEDASETIAQLSKKIFDELEGN